MPAILEPEEMDRWLDPNASVSSARDMLRPASGVVLIPHPVSECVNSPANYDLTLIDPVDAS